MRDDAPHYDVFISYARQDETRLGHVSRLESDLRAQGFRVWRDTRGIDPARDFTAEIERAIEASDFVVACITPDVRRDNSFVRREIQYALLSHKPVIVARFDAATLPPIHVINNTFVEFHKDWQIAQDQLRGYLRGGPDAITRSPQPADPFRPYVEGLYQWLVRLLDQAVIRQIDLSAEDSPEAVDHPHPRRASLDQRFLPFTPKDAPPAAPAGEPEVFTRFERAFDHYRGRLLLLGEPGAGKSVTLMAHARESAARRLSDPSAPLPLFGIIATWNAPNQTPLADWLAGSYDNLDAAALRGEIEAGRALLLLDGLDELGREIREEPESGRNAFTSPPDPLSIQNREGEKAAQVPLSNLVGERDLGGEVQTRDPRRRFLDIIPASNRVVVSCRIADYAEISQKAALNGAVTLQPLSETQLRVYLEKQPDLLAAVEADPDLKQMLTTPLILSLFAFAYRDMTPEDAAQLRDLAHSPGELRDAIIGRYVRERYAWEDRKHGPLPFTLEEVHEVLGRAAMEDASKDWRENVLEAQDFKLGNECLQKFTALVIRLNLLATGNEKTRHGENTWRFVHLLLRVHFALPYALARLHDPDWRVRMRAAKALGRLGDIRTIGSLLQTLRDPDESVRDHAATALGRLGKPALEPLLQTLHDPDFKVRRNAVFALGLLGDARAVEPLIQTLGDTGVEVRGYAAFALGRLGDARAVEPLIQTLRDDRVEVRPSAALALGRLGDARAVEPLIQALRDDRVGVRRAAAEALGLLGDTRAVAPLLRALGDADVWTRKLATEALEKLGDTSAVESLIQALHDDDAEVRRTAVEALESLGDARAVEPLIQALRDADIYVRGNAAEALGKLRDDRAVEPLIHLLHDTEQGVCLRAALALRRIGTPEAFAAAFAAVEAYRRGQIKPGD